MKNNLIWLSVFLFLFSACAAPPQKAGEEKIPAEKKRLTQEEQGKMAFEIFNEIYKVTEGVEDRQAMLPKIEAKYQEIVDNYPDATLAEESYLRLIAINIQEFKPLRPERAEKLYQDFISRYPDSLLMISAEQMIGQYYYMNKMWSKLLKIFTPQVKQYIKTGKLSSPYHVFMYSEAKFNLGDIKEAEKGYKIVIEFFPQTREGKVSKHKLNDIQGLKKQGGGK